MTLAAGSGPVLDMSGEPWRGSFPGLGSIWVAADGEYGVEPEPGAEGVDTVEMRATALEAGWAELLSWRRQGFELWHAVAVHDVARDATLLLARGGPETSSLVLELAQRGWTLIADDPTPVRLSDGPAYAQPRTTPVLGPRRRGGDSVRARGDTDAVVLDVARHATPGRIMAIAVVERTAVGRPDVEPVTGRDKVVTATRLRAGGVLTDHPDDPEDPDADVAARSADLLRDLQISRLPMCAFRVRPDSPDGFGDEADRVEEWWRGLDASGG